MNITRSGRLWAFLWSDTWGVARGIYPRPGLYAVFKWWHLGPLEVRRFYHPCEYGRLYPTRPSTPPPAPTPQPDTPQGSDR